ncbi:MAG: hypothetical protein ABIS27_06895 [Longimicrobiales bacterium]
MNKRAISVTLGSDNVTWLKGRAGAEGESVSELLDQFITSARSGNRAGPGHSVIGTIDIDDSDPLLERADAAVRAAFDASLGRPVVVRKRKAMSRGKTRNLRG